MDAPIHVLLVDDEPGIRHVLGALIKDFGYAAHTAESAREALEAFAAHPFPIVVTDIRMPGMDGLALLERVRKQAPDTQVISMNFADGKSMTWEGRSCNGTPVDGFGVGTAFYGETGTLFISGGNEYRIADMGGKTVKEVKSALKFEEGNLLNPSEQLDVIHFRNWFDAIRKGEKLNSGIVDACISTQLV